jgi:indolepyruvate ferredoxin oxidoreductase beta subunit
MTMKFSILVAGIGGQGIITLGKIIAMGGKIAGYDVIGAENRGGAQRGGKASSLIRLYRQVESDLISARLASGQLDLMLATDLFETGRYAKLYSGNTIIVSNRKAIPPPLARCNETQNSIDPVKLLRILLESFPRIYCEDFSYVATIVMESEINLNLALLAFASRKGFLPVGTDELAQAIEFILGVEGVRKFNVALSHFSRV